MSAGWTVLFGRRILFYFTVYLQGVEAIEMLIGSDRSNMSVFPLLYL